VLLPTIGGVRRRFLCSRCGFVRRFAHHFERSDARSEYEHAWWIFRFGRSGFEGSSSGNLLAKRPKDYPGEGDDACLPDRLPVDRGIVGAENCRKYGPVNGCFGSDGYLGSRPDGYLGSRPDGSPDLSNRFPGSVPSIGPAPSISYTPQVTLCERSELYVPQKLLLQFVCFTIPNESVLLVGEVRGYPGAMADFVQVGNWCAPGW
jgi:hypothetical protein